MFGTYIQWNITQPQKEWNLVICDKMGGPRRHYAKKNLLDNKTNTVQFHLHVESKI